MPSDGKRASRDLLLELAIQVPEGRGRAAVDSTEVSVVHGQCDVWASGPFGAGNAAAVAEWYADRRQ